MSTELPFSFQKKAGMADRFLYNGVVIDEYLSIQELRDTYFCLAGESFKVGQKSCSKFPRKADLIAESCRLIVLYVTEPSLWDITLQKEKEKLEKKVVNAEKKAAKAAAEQLKIEEEAQRLAALSSKEFELLQKAMAYMIANNMRSDTVSSSDTE